MPLSKSTQEFVPIKEIRDGVVILQDGSLRMVLMASTLNFALKSEDEQEAIIMQYQNFLNSLDFPVQFFVESRNLDVGPYLTSLQETEKEQTNELLKIQTKEYIEFVRTFVKTTNIVNKSFYIVVPYSQAAFTGKESLFAGVAKIFEGEKANRGNEDIKFEEAKLQLQQRTDVVRQGLVRAGIRTAPLNTEELVELYYKLFNPGEIQVSK